MNTTKENWKFVKDNSPHEEIAIGYPFFITTTNPNGGLIARVVELGDTNKKESEKCARLLAAAPELLEALKELIRIRENGDVINSSDLDSARAIVAKAEGV